MVFQHFNLWPHMTAIGNVAEPLRRVRGLPAREAAERAMAMLTRVGLADKAARLSRRICRAASSSGWPSPGRWRCSRA